MSEDVKQTTIDRPDSTDDHQITPEILQGVIEAAYRFETVQPWNEALADGEFIEIWASRAIVKLNQIASALKEQSQQREHAAYERGKAEGAEAERGRIKGEVYTMMEEYADNPNFPGMLLGFAVGFADKILKTIEQK